MGTKRKREGSTFVAERASSAPLAMRPSALSLFWYFGCGEENATHGRVSVVTIDGPLEHRSSWWDGYDAIIERFRAACGDENTTSIVLRLSSPGGDCAGLFECARMMRESAAKSGKRVVAFADESAYSAAYALACVADEIYLPASGGVGSVGVIATCLDRTALNERVGLNVAVIHAGARKADCHPDVPLSEEAIAGVQEDVDALAGMFRELVAGARSLAVEDVEALEAACLMGADAVAAGLADGILGFDELLVMLNEEAGDTDTENEDEAVDAAPNEGTEDMGAKNKTATGAIKASDVTEIDALAKPAVATPDRATLGAAASRLGAKSEEAEETKAEEEEEETEEEAADEEGSDEEMSDEEAEETKAEDDSEEEAAEEEEESDEEEEDDGEEEASGKRPAPVAAAPSNATSAHVLRAVRELTGESSPAAQIGALHALRDKAATAGKHEAAAKRAAAKSKAAERDALIASAIRTGKLEPARKAWAKTQTIESLRAYLKTGSKVAPTTPLRQKPTKGPSGKSSTASGEAAVDEAIANVARTMQMDPTAIAAHAAELRKAGVIH